MVQSSSEPDTGQVPDEVGKVRQGLIHRRRLLRAGAAAAPVLMTLGSGRVAADVGPGGGVCFVASSFISVATYKSRNPGFASATCLTQNVEQYQSLAGGPTCPAYLTPLVVDFFGPLAPPSVHNDKTLCQVLVGTGLDPQNLVLLQHLIAVTLQLVGAPQGSLTDTYMKSVWRDFKNGGDSYPLPSLGTSWNEAELITWLRVLMYPLPP